MSITAWEAGTLYLPGAIVTSKAIPAIVAGDIANPDFELGNVNWILSGDFSIQTTDSFNGTQCLVLDTNATVYSTALNDAYSDCSPGQDVTLRCKVFTAIPTSISIGYAFYNSSKVRVQQAGFVVQRELVGGIWADVERTLTAPANTAFVRVSITSNGTDGLCKIDALTWNLSSSGGSTDGLFFKAVQEESALSGDAEPTWPETIGETVVDNEVTWEVIEATTVTWEASPLLVSGTVEPVWPVLAGGVVPDGTMEWECVRLHIEDENCPHTREVAIGASKIFAGDYDITRFSATLSPRDWTTEEDAGFLPTGLHQGEQVGVTALGVYRGNLAVWSHSSFQVWQIDPDPASMALLDEMEGIGSSHHKAVQPVSNDLFFLAALGVRTVGVAAASTNLATGDAGVPVDPLIQADVDNTVDPIGTYYPSMGQYWLAFPPTTVSNPGYGDPDDPTLPVPPVEPPPEAEELYLTSKPYDLFVYDSLQEAVVETDGRMVVGNFVHFDEDVSLLSGSLTHIITYGYFTHDEPETFTESVDIVGGILTQVIGYRSEDLGADYVTESVDILSGTLVGVIEFLYYETEDFITEEVSLLSGTLTAV